jgi:hypothetical protein
VEETMTSAKSEQEDHKGDHHDAHEEDFISSGKG